MRRNPISERATGEITEAMGPAMRALATNQMRAFVIELQDGPDLNYSRAARAAGYGGKGSDDQVVWNAAYRLAHNPKVIEAINEEAHRRLGASAGWTVSQLINLGQSAKSDSDKRGALKDILDRIPGFGTKTEHNVNVTHKDERSTRELLLTAAALAKQLGIAGPMKLLNGPVVDAEFKTVDPDEATLGEL